MPELLAQFDTRIIGLLVALAIVVVLVAAGIYILRYFLRGSQLVRSGPFATMTLMVTVPKFVTEAEIRGEETIAKIQEDISIAETFYSAIGGLKAQKGLRAWLFGRSDVMALEIASHETLTTFYITVPKYLQEFVQQQLQAQYPNSAIEEVVDYNIFSPAGTIVGGYLVFKRDNALPIKTYKELEADPLNAITNAMSKVPKNEGLTVQYIVRSARADWRSLGRKIVKGMQKGLTFQEAKKGKPFWLGWFKSKEARESEAQKRAERQLTQAEQQMLTGIENKSSKAGMEVNIRIISSGATASAAQANLNQVLQSFSQFNIYEFGNAFTKDIPSNKNKLIRGFIYRLFDEKYGIVLNTEEMASLWHLPLASTETPNIRWMAARVASAPANTPTEGLHLGYNEYRGTRRDIYMLDTDRRRHMYIIGKTGSGKSYLIRYLAVQDIINGKGVCVIDPHGDLVDAIMGMIPKERIDDVIYFNPSDTDRPMGLNMLEAPDESMRDFAVQEMISIFYMLFPPEMIGPMFEHNMRNFMLTLMSDLKNPGTIVEIPRMIADDKFQRRWIAKVTDPIVRSFWEDEMAKTSDYHKSEMMGYLVSKVGRFVENEMMRNIIGQAKSAFDFRKVMDEEKILLINLSKGKTGEVNANLLGLILVSKLQMAAFSRADIPEEERKDFYLYIDEFQNFITPSIATILSEARKYRLNLILAHQYMGQLVQDGKTEIRDAVLGNVGSMLVSRVGPEDTEVLGKVFEPTFSPYDLMNTDKFTWSVKLIIGNAQAKPFSLKAVLPDKPNAKLAEALKEISRLTYGRSKDIVEREIALRAGLGLKQVKPKPVPAPPSL
ncbi:type IV secretion system DNA-binding domain-containing protein [Patescibacteria group bacterium]|nr:type IV secretion system DNA-binding domain-containing protein [Patescibacteria group bacterium]